MWGLFGISFLYGVFHAVGPGHRKAVISSYLVANEETWRRGVVLSFASAGIQSVVAILVVAIAAALLGATAKVIGLAVHVVEIVSYGLVILIGLRLLYVKSRGFLIAFRELRWADASVLSVASGYGGKTFQLGAPRLGAIAMRGGQCSSMDAWRMVRTRAGPGMLAMRAIEAGAAALIVAFGTLLLAGYMASERLWMFTG
ncbi:hypothetical protein [Bradyrhizobium sp. Leo170]|uniref:HoxN/HupN/NixA family nickel/cobalt transporter n=1 Tax=Bradyrhizobium sp. Leo170 TaxID=1571199 RepID=UPI001FDF32EB|nr:hypothetical protein [Bradyrhizobium sp. Leo170]